MRSLLCFWVTALPCFITYLWRWFNTTLEFLVVIPIALLLPHIIISVHNHHYSLHIACHNAKSQLVHHHHSPILCITSTQSNKRDNTCTGTSSFMPLAFPPHPHRTFGRSVITSAAFFGTQSLFCDS